MHDSYLLLTPVLVFGVLGLVRFVGCDIIFGLQHVPDPPLDFVTNTAFGTARNDYSGFAGMAVEIGGKSLKVKNLQRYCVDGSTGTPRVKIIDAATGMDVPTAVVVVSLTGHKDIFVSADLPPNGVTLTAGKQYYIVSEEKSGGDQFFDNDTVLTTRSDATIVSPVYFDDTVQQWVLLGNPGSSYGPVNFGYDKP